ncbi:MAG: acetolactate synthase large subunit, partial [Planctomycetota bacterium]
LVSGNNIPPAVREAIRLAEEEKPGAVHLELPEDIAAEQTDEPTIAASYTRRPIAETKAIRAAIEKIESAKHPLLIVAAGANRKRTCESLRTFIERFGIPFVTTQMGKGVVDERSELFLGNAALSSGDFVHRAVEAADLIINVGHDVVEKPPFFMQAGGVDVIHVNFFSAKVDPVYFPQVEVVGDISGSIWHFNDQMQKQDHWDFSRFMEVRRHLEKHLEHGIADDRFPIYPKRLVADVRKAVEKQGIIALDNGVYKIWFARNYKSHSPNSVLLDNALATMGAGLPSAIAAKIVHPERSVTAICGDGGFMMNSQELETAVRLKLHLVILILRDDAYGMIKWKQSNMGFDSFGLDYGNPDFVRYAESYGASGHRVTSAKGLLPLLQQCHQEPGVHVIEIPVDYSENDQILNHEIKELSSKI